MTTDIYGPQHKHVQAFIDSLRNVTPAEWDAAYDEAHNTLYDPAYDPAYGVAYDALYDALYAALYDPVYDAAYDEAWSAVRGAAWEATLAIVVRDRITKDHYDLLVSPMRLTSAVIPDWKEGM
jgi:hypothetical protein